MTRKACVVAARGLSAAEDIAAVVSRWTGVPVSQLTTEERERLLRLEERLHSRVVGQQDAVRAVAQAVRRSRAGLAEPSTSPTLL